MICFIKRKSTEIIKRVYSRYQITGVKKLSCMRRLGGIISLWYKAAIRFRSLFRLNSLKNGLEGSTAVDSDTLFCGGSD